MRHLGIIALFLMLAALTVAAGPGCRAIDVYEYPPEAPVAGGDGGGMLPAPQACIRAVVDDDDRVVGWYWRGGHGHYITHYDDTNFLAATALYWRLPDGTYLPPTPPDDPVIVLRARD